jgi:PBSX family phage terminase large subunit
LDNIKLILEELQKRKKLLSTVPLKLFKQQQQVIDDASTMKTCVCSRRSGKSILAIAYLIKTAIEHPGSQCVYLGKTRQSAKNVVWRQLRKFTKNICKKEDYNESELRCKIGDSIIYLAGADKPVSIESLRGNHYKLIVVDECSSLINLQYLVEDVLLPTLIDDDGTILLISTPGAPVGYFYQSTKNSNFKVFSWLTDVNPHIKPEVLARYKSKYNPNSPAYKREFEAQFAAAEDAVFTYTDKNLTKPIVLKEGEWQFLIGLDLGFRDDTAGVLFAHSRFYDKIYAVDCFSKDKLSIAKIAEQIDAMLLRNKLSKKEVLICYDAAAKIYATELSSRFNFNMLPAKKQDKVGNISRLNSLLYQNKFQLFIPSMGPLLNQFDTLTWQDGGKEQWKPGVPDHIADSCLYGISHIISNVTPESAPEQTKNKDEWELELIRRYQQQQYELKDRFGERIDNTDNGYLRHTDYI